uniref:Uncharacterized protein n=1 Tax=Hyaloperonospora arabidopsidis (strain Emoy2) TaxID=559515 RepID=M4C5A0_HYAAE
MHVEGLLQRWVQSVGDGAAVLGKENKENGELQAMEVSADHVCDYSHENKLVIEHLHDRTAKPIIMVC